MCYDDFSTSSSDHFLVLYLSFPEIKTAFRFPFVGVLSKGCVITSSPSAILFEAALSYINKIQSSRLSLLEAFTVRLLCEPCKQTGHIVTYFFDHENTINVGVCLEKIWAFVNFTRHVRTSRNIAQHGVKSDGRCCANMMNPFARA